MDITDRETNLMRMKRELSFGEMVIHITGRDPVRVEPTEKQQVLSIASLSYAMLRTCCRFKSV